MTNKLSKSFQNINLCQTKKEACSNCFYTYPREEYELEEIGEDDVFSKKSDNTQKEPRNMLSAQVKPRTFRKASRPSLKNNSSTPRNTPRRSQVPSNNGTPSVKRYFSLSSMDDVKPDTSKDKKPRSSTSN